MENYLIEACDKNEKDFDLVVLEFFQHESAKVQILLNNDSNC